MSMGKLPDPTDGDGLDDGVVAEINITPLTDIFLVLLVIFMVTSSALVEAGGQTGVEVDLPGQGTAADKIGAPNDLVVAILDDGRAISGGQELDETGLGALFESAARASNGTTLILQADKGVPHGRVVQVMELAKSKGLANLAIATQASESTD
ncbi:MAG: biopolymer transporter ExbD [Myxococcaceae bacterium]|nr:biopolymer transporter ExbD [Myxococcaceae bacterium]